MVKSSFKGFLTGRPPFSPDETIMTDDAALPVHHHRESKRKQDVPGPGPGISGGGEGKGFADGRRKQPLTWPDFVRIYTANRRFLDSGKARIWSPGSSRSR